MKKILVFGNSGSGKSTLSRHLSVQHDLPYLDLDTICWASPGVRKPVEDSTIEVIEFINANSAWVIEGCYGSLIEVVSEYCNEMIFLNPGIEACLDNNRKRPWEPHKYPSKEAQDKNLAMLQDWVKEYENRDDEYSYEYHQNIFTTFEGNKKELNEKHVQL
ncbi:MAG: shikimate kinase [Gammaproteobacteria bacterium]|nr:shikimate kinase [Gammaproteobacteria bacterium]